MSQTLMMIKPDAVEKGMVGDILADVAKAGLRIAQLRMVHLTEAEAKEFYSVHAERPFYGELVEFMTRGPIVVGVLDAAEAVPLWRATMGATNPADAEAGTIRATYGANIQENATHGSDSDENAAIEIGFFGLTHNLR
jgi:nucleoside-diphosphate kinase